MQSPEEIVSHGSWLEAWMTAWKDRLARHIKRYVRDAELAEDITQETFLRLYEWHRAHPDRDIQPGWLFTVAYRLAIDYLRARKRFVLHTALMRPPAPHDDELGTLIRDLVERLPPRDQRAVALFYYADLSLVEVAQAMHSSPSEVKSRLYRARRRMARLWRDQGG
jgi:RNA polymerase sigma-70 factor (ECF subfamily)